VIHLDRLPPFFGHQPLGNRLGSTTLRSTLLQHTRAATTPVTQTQQFDLLKKQWLLLKVPKMLLHLLPEWVLSAA
jgi:hypothetical protein